MLTDVTGCSKVIFDVPKVMSKMPQPPPLYKRGADHIYIFAQKNAYFSSSNMYILGRLTRPLALKVALYIAIVLALPLPL